MKPDPVENARTIELFKQGIPMFSVLADQARLDIVLHLSNNGELNVGDLTALMPLSRPAISHHLRLLKNTGLVAVRKLGTEHWYRLTLATAVGMLKELTQRIETHCHLE